MEGYTPGVDEFQSEANASSIQVIDWEILALFAATLPSVAAFNRRETSGPGPTGGPAYRSRPWFGTHVREAAEVFREWWESARNR